MVSVGGLLRTWAGASLLVLATVAWTLGTTSVVSAQDPGSPTPATSAIEPTPTIPPEFNNNPLGGTEGNFDSRALGISVVVGLVFAFGIYLVWRFVRPKNPTFGGRARGGR